MAEGADCPPWLDLGVLLPRQSVLLALLQATCTQLEAAGVPCWITGGTLVGALRHDGFVPHDDDVDLECELVNEKLLKEAFRDHAFLTFRRGGLWGETPVAHVGLRGSDVELDIFLRETPLRELRDFPSQLEVFPLRPYAFNGLSVPGPAQPLPFLARLYGEDWAKVVKVWSHDFNDVHGLAHDPERVALQLAEYSALVDACGWRPPALPVSGSGDEALEALLREGGEVEALKKAHAASWLEKLRRRNREQAEAQLRLAASRTAGQGEGAGTEDGEAE